MKVLFDHPNPFLLAHGGLQTQIEQTKKALGEIGIEIEWLRWWDEKQTGDLIHYFGRPGPQYIEFAHSKGIPVVISDLLTGLGSRGAFARTLQTLAISTLRRSAFFDRMGWRSYQFADAVVMLTPWEASLVCSIFASPSDRVSVVPNGVERVFLDHAPTAKTSREWLVCTATVTSRKRVLELAEAAALAGTPLWVIGKPYSAVDPYFRKFKELAVKHPRTLRYEGPISDRAALARIYGEARGFVLLSTMESLSLSALEAAACGCPLLLGDLPWAKTTFAGTAEYCPVRAGVKETARHLSRFYDEALNLPTPPRPATWLDVAGQLRAVYERVLSTSR